MKSLSSVPATGLTYQQRLLRMEKQLTFAIFPQMYICVLFHFPKVHQKYFLDCSLKRGWFFPLMFLTTLQHEKSLCILVTIYFGTYCHDHTVISFPFSLFCFESMGDYKDTGHRIIKPRTKIKIGLGRKLKAGTQRRQAFSLCPSFPIAFILMLPASLVQVVETKSTCPTICHKRPGVTLSQHSQSL